MKLSGAAARAYARAPSADHGAILLWGPDAARVAEARRALLPALLGEGAAEEMRLAELPADELRRDPAALQDAMGATGFFPGPRAVLVEGATDGLAPVLADAMAARRAGDAVLVLTAGSLTKGSKLRKIVEGAKDAVAVAFYDDPPGPAEVRALLAERGLDADEDALGMLAAFGAEEGAAALRDAADRLALYRHGATGRADAEDVAALLPAPPEAEADRIAAAACEGDAAAVARLLRRQPLRPAAATALMISAARQLRVLHQVATGGAGSVRPPLFGPRRDAAERQARTLGTERIEAALQVVMEADLALRAAGRTVPAAALAERTLLRVAALAGRRGRA